MSSLDCNLVTLWSWLRIKKNFKKMEADRYGSCQLDTFDTHTGQFWSLTAIRSLCQRLWHKLMGLGKWEKHCQLSELEVREKYKRKWKEFPLWNNKTLYWLSQRFCSSVQWQGCGGLHYLSFLSQSVNHFPGLVSNRKPLGSPADFFFFCLWPWIQPSHTHKK